MAKVKWSKVRKGDRVEIRGVEYEVVRAKPKGKHVKVSVRGKAGTFESKVLATDKVKLAPLHDDKGAMKRWATDREAKRSMPRGDRAVTKPPAPASGDVWETRRDRVERRLDELLGARLVGETDDESSGYYVPPVDVSTVAAHVALFHDADPSEHGIDDLMQLHDDQHAAALNGAPLHVNHWHTEQRPAVS